MRGKAIIDACCAHIGLVKTATVPAAKIRDAIHAKTGVLIPRDYFHNLYYDDSAVSEPKRTVFAQFLGIDVTEITLYSRALIVVPSKAYVKRLDAEQKLAEFNRLAVQFITRPLVNEGVSHEV